MSFMRDNLLPRLRLLRTAFTRRFIYPDLIAQVQRYGAPINDVVADVGPFDFLARVNGATAEQVPEFARDIAPLESFVPVGEPAFFNAEPSVARFLAQLVHHLQPRTVVELGCFVGWTSVHLGLALQARGGTGRLYCVDSMRKYLDAAVANLARHGVRENVTALCGFSLDAPVLAALPASIDVVFLDTSHNYPETLHEIEAYAPRLSARGCLVLHDSINAPGVRRSLREVKGFARHTFATERSNGVTILFPQR